MKFILSISCLFLCFFAVAQKKHYLLTGTYTSGKSTGVYVYAFNKNAQATLVDSVTLSNPSYLAVTPNKQFVYAVNEEGNNANGGKVAAFAFDKNKGSLTELNKESSAGDHPCYITVDKTGQWLIVGNYSSGTVGVLPIKKDGSLGEAVSTVQHTGSGPNKARQKSAHVHATVLSPDNKFLFVPDLGIDKLMIYSFNAKTGKLTPAKEPFIQLSGGSGPRHFDFHPSGKWAYLLQELSGTITVFSYNTGLLKIAQSINSLPNGFTKPFTSADIHVSPDGKFLYASNRDSSNTIGIFKIHPKTGTLSLVGHQSTLGRTPRNFNFDPTGNYLLVANQNSDAIVVFKVDRATGLLTDTRQNISIGNPVCIKWITN